MPRYTGVVTGKDGLPLDGVTVRLARADTGATLGSAVTGEGGEPNSRLHLPLQSGFSDVSPTGATATANGGLAINSDWPIAGLPTAKFDANGKTITIPSNPAFAVAAGQDFTIDVSIFYPSDAFVFSSFQFLFTIGATLLSLRLDSNAGYIYINGAVHTFTPFTPVLNQAGYIRVKRTSGGVELFYNGSKVGSTITDASAIAAADITIGAYNGLYHFRGGMSHLRYVIGEALPGNGQIAPLPSGAGTPGGFEISTAHTGECHRVIQSPYGDRNHLIAKVTPGGA